MFYFYPKNVFNKAVFISQHIDLIFNLYLFSLIYGHNMLTLLHKLFNKYCIIHHHSNQFKYIFLFSTSFFFQNKTKYFRTAEEKFNKIIFNFHKSIFKGLKD